MGRVAHLIFNYTDRSLAALSFVRDVSIVLTLSRWSVRINDRSVCGGSCASSDEGVLATSKGGGEQLGRVCLLTLALGALGGLLVRKEPRTLGHSGR
jgi:hypothetical protein